MTISGLRFVWVTISLVMSVTCLKIAHRFDINEIRGHHLKMAIIDLGNMAEAVETSESFVHSAFKRVNYSIEHISTMDMGGVSETGNPTGFMGKFIAKKLDVAVFYTLLSSFNHGNISLGVPLSGLHLKLYSRLSWKQPEAADVIHSLRQMSSTTLSYFLIIVHVMASLFHCMQLGVSPGRYVQTSWHLFRCSIGQDYFKVISVQRCLWTLFNTLVQIFIIGYILNLLSTDGVVTKPARRIEALEDLLDPYFSRVKLFLLKSDPLFDAVKQSSSGTVLGQLYHKMAAINDCSQVDTCHFYESDDFTDMAQGIELFRAGVEKGDSALLLNQEGMERVAQVVICKLEPMVLARLYTAPQEIVSDVVMSFYRSNLNAQAEKYVRYKFTALYESDQLWKLVGKLSHLYTEAIPNGGQGDAYYRCLEGSLKVDQASVNPVQLTILKRPLIISSVAILFTIVILAVETKFATWRDKLRTVKMRPLTRRRAFVRRPGPTRRPANESCTVSTAVKKLRAIE
ncbi:hypothetical protein HDE_02206 [Halotydeus destructor]|nr:hypothetical protein HDE_02206 [Halotydeus destructor]